MRPLSRLLGAGLALLIVVASGCDESPTGPSLAEEFTLAASESALIPEAGLRVRFDGVEGDSRCPADVVCVQGGDAVVRITVIDRSTEWPYELHTGSMAPVNHESLTIALVRLQPYPFSSRTIEPDEYRVTLIVTR
jgi:hypothetical protein